MALKCLSLLLAFCCCLLTVHADEFIIQLDKLSQKDAFPQCRLRARGGASNKGTLWFTTGETITYRFCLSQPSSLTVKNLAYSNDGDKDTLIFTVDGKVIGNVVTEYRSDEGKLWDVFINTDTIGGPQNLPAGEHRLTITAEQTDKYGIELDFLLLYFTGPVTDNSIRCADIQTRSTPASFRKCNANEIQESTTSQQPTTRRPSTRPPTTRRPSTRPPTTRRPSTRPPTTRRLSTRPPTTRRPSTRPPTTPWPTTPLPTTRRPTTFRPTHTDKVEISGPGGQIMTLRRTNDLICRTGTAQFDLTSQQTTQAVLSVNQGQKAPLHPSFGFRNNPVFSIRRGKIGIEGYSGSGKDMFLNIGARGRVKVSSLVFSTAANSFGEVAPRIILYQDGSFVLFPSDMQSSQPRFQIVTRNSNRDDPGLDINSLSVYTNGDKVELDVQSNRDNTKVILDFSNGRTQVTLTSVGAERGRTPLTSLIMPCWQQGNIRTRALAAADGTDYESLFDVREEFTGARIVLKLDDLTR